MPLVALWGERYVGITRHVSKFYTDAAAGQHFMNTIYEAVINSPYWSSTAMIINHDEWGGFFDDVNPAAESGLRGLRDPVFVISPYAPRKTVNSDVYDHTSILRMIEWNWDLPNLTSRDVSGTPNFADLFNATPVVDPRHGTFPSNRPRAVNLQRSSLATTTRSLDPDR